MRKLRFMFVWMFTVLIALSIIACSNPKPKTFEEACAGLKQQVLAKNYACNFYAEEIYGRPVYIIEVYYYDSVESYAPSAVAALLRSRLTNEFKPYIEENFSQFKNESIWVEVVYNGIVYDSARGFIYGYYAS